MAFWRCSSSLSLPKFKWQLWLWFHSEILNDEKQGDFTVTSIRLSFTKENTFRLWLQQWLPLPLPTCGSASLACQLPTERRCANKRWSGAGSRCANDHQQTHGGQRGGRIRRARPWCCLFRCCREGVVLALAFHQRAQDQRQSGFNVFFTMVVVGCLAIVERRGSSGFSPVIPRSPALSNVFSDPEVSAGNVCLPEKRVGAQWSCCCFH